MINDIEQIIKAPAVSKELVESVFSVKLQPDAGTTTRVVQVYKGQCAAGAIHYDHVEYRQFGSGSRFFLIVYMHGRQAMPYRQLESALGRKGAFTAGNPAHKELPVYKFAKGSDVLEFCVAEDNFDQLVFFTIDGTLKK